MVLWIASRRWAWVKYPIYDHDEKEDNLDNDPTEPRNTTVTLAQELAACHENLIVFEVDPLPLALPSPPGSIAHGHHDLDETESTKVPQPTNKKESLSSRRSATEPIRRPERSGSFQFTGSFAPISFLPDQHISLGQFIARNPYEPWKSGEH
ncbi:hypothetical protein VTN00DRAFT_9492 [Thermoascus crustaceus]|uniref:uncharacterized protein n=1 Tax=Thermoascus crustaceus TaxID=5088 RepID=UPI00374467A9